MVNAFVRYLILSDIHANWEALQAVLEAAGKDGYDQILCLGDLVGYGADPNACVEWVRANVRTLVRGNHDKACVGLEDLEWFNPAARASAQWTNGELTEENREWLSRLAKGPLPVAEFMIFHGSPVDEDEYIMQANEAAMVAGYLDTRISFFGHTHLQGGFRFLRAGIRNIQRMGPRLIRTEFSLDHDSFYMINPGSVGQPRDGDPRAAWAIYEPEERLVVYRRTAYDIRAAQDKILATGVPDILAKRLGVGR